MYLEIDNYILLCLRIFDHMPDLKTFRIGETIEQFNLHMSEQTDFRIEAHNLRVFEKNFRESYLSAQVTFPRPIPGLTTEEVCSYTLN